NSVREGDEVRLGLGMRPDLTGRGLAQPFIEAGLDYARAEWRPKRFRLWVAWWNERALRAYRRAGFRAVAEHEGKSRFIEMERPARSASPRRCGSRPPSSLSRRRSSPTASRPARASRSRSSPSDRCARPARYR